MPRNNGLPTMSFATTARMGRNSLSDFALELQRSEMVQQRAVLMDEGEWTDEMEENHNNTLREIEAQEAAQNSNRSAPVLVATRTVRTAGGRMHYLTFKRGENTLDEYRGRSPEDVASRFPEYSRSIEQDLTHSLWRTGTGMRADIRGERVEQFMKPNTRRGRIDRRSIRPKDDTITEDGLVLDIDPETKEEKNTAKKVAGLPPFVELEPFIVGHEEWAEIDQF